MMLMKADLAEDGLSAADGRQNNQRERKNEGRRLSSEGELRAPTKTDRGGLVTGLAGEQRPPRPDVVFAP